MEIYVNDQQLEFEMSKSENLASILSQIESWAGQKDLYVIDYKLDGKESTSKDLEKPLEQISSNSIARLDISLGDRLNLILKSLNDVFTYLDRIGEFIANSFQQKKELKESDQEIVSSGLNWVLDSVNALMEYFGSPDGLKSHCQALHQALKENDQKDYEALIKPLAGIREYLENWKNQMNYQKMDQADREKVLKEFIEGLPKVQDSLEEIAEKFTMGQEPQALSQLETTLEFLSSGLGVMDLLGKTNEHTQKLLDFLSELTSALDEQDNVTAADILDYDLRETIDAILESFSAEKSPSND